MIEVYQDMYQKAPRVEAVHAGLECGLFYEKIPGLDCVSTGPNLWDIHTPAGKDGDCICQTCLGVSDTGSRDYEIVFCHI